MAVGYFWLSVGLCAIVFVLALDIMGLFSRRNHFDVEGRTVIITGGSQGMGRGLGKLLARKGANVVIVARNRQKLDAALEYIQAAAKDSQRQRFLAISADLTSPAENDRLIQEVTAWNHSQPPDIVWANAGQAQPMLFLEASVQVLKQQMDVNYFAAAYLAQSTLKTWIKPVVHKSSNSQSGPPQSRHFIVTSSVVCFAGVAGYAPYAPPKSAMRSLADTLRSEVNLYNGARRRDAADAAAADIKIHCVCPGTITTPGHEEEQKTKHEITMILEEGDPAQDEDQVAAAAVRGLESGGYLITTQLLGHAMRVSAMGGSPRNNWFIDTVFSWATAVAWLFIGPDMEAKVFKYGKKHGHAAT